ncbi:MAG TPA: J domain-containing protein [Caulobacteraceae bacterium]|nr:J domain-containing protein [Caulobacteraceae bacterium]
MQVGFINHYETLGADPRATAREIERKFRQLARRYHPDNQATGDRARFDAVVEAHKLLSDLGRRARYHEDHHQHLPPLPQFTEDGSETGEEANGAAVDRDAFIDMLGIDRDISVQNNILTLLYHKRRMNTREPGVGDAELERLSGCPPEHLDFHVWYLKAKGWVRVGEDGLLAITVEGVDRAAALYRESANKLITDQS